mgnify:CR=1 FL=1
MSDEFISADEVVVSPRGRKIEINPELAATLKKLKPGTYTVRAVASRNNNVAPTTNCEGTFAVVQTEKSGVFADALTWLDIHGGLPEIVEHWRGFVEAIKVDGPPPEGANPARRRRRRRRRSFKPSPAQ